MNKTSKAVSSVITKSINEPILLSFSETYPLAVRIRYMVTTQIPTAIITVNTAFKAGLIRHTTFDISYRYPVLSSRNQSHSQPVTVSRSMPFVSWVLMRIVMSAAMNAGTRSANDTVPVTAFPK